MAAVTGAVALSGGLTMEAILGGCASLIETRADVAAIDWDANPIIPVPQNGCYTAWYLGLAVASYYDFAVGLQEKHIKEWYEDHFGKVPAVHCSACKSPGADRFPNYTSIGIYNKGVIPLWRYYLK